ncbi:hypothetical protein UFOVP229_14 [uncultured Caudovirales phage]|uniref:Uncharacterized protein n=1 Tax=uncultured Caudovirales phage TaxID=2100421 RepID=A0A6J7WQG6_9CAUD|nr:hypothetical protein UFOVP229_14 [uncultured Caudovirales phage]
MNPENNLKKRKHMYNMLYKAKLRAKAKEIPCDVDLEYLCSIAPDICPVFGFELLWGRNSKTKRGSSQDASPSLDRINPEKGYVKGNVAIISNKANMIKSNAKLRELYAVADWLHDKLKEIDKYGSLRPPSIFDPANTYVQRPTNPRVNTSAAARQRGGY